MTLLSKITFPLVVFSPQYLALLFNHSVDVRTSDVFIPNFLDIKLYANTNDVNRNSNVQAIFDVSLCLTAKFCYQGPVVQN